MEANLEVSEEETERVKATHMLAEMRGRSSDVLRGRSKGATYEKTAEALEDRFRDQNLVADYRNQLKTWIKILGESLQEFSCAIYQVT
jgi:hypothetical protein